jgi:hypothetical protein
MLNLAHSAKWEITSPKGKEHHKLHALSCESANALRADEILKKCDGMYRSYSSACIFHDIKPNASLWFDLSEVYGYSGYKILDISTLNDVRIENLSSIADA